LLIVGNRVNLSIQSIYILLYVGAHTNEPKTAKELSDWNNFCDAFLCTACMMFYFYRLARFTRSTKIRQTTGVLTTRNKRHAHYHLVT